MQLASQPLALLGRGHLLRLLEQTRVVNRQTSALRQRLDDALLIQCRRVLGAEGYPEYAERLTRNDDRSGHGALDALTLDDLAQVQRREVRIVGGIFDHHDICTDQVLDHELLSRAQREED